jgi:hypothetical protein
MRKILQKRQVVKEYESCKGSLAETDSVPCRPAKFAASFQASRRMFAREIWNIHALTRRRRCVAYTVRV